MILGSLSFAARDWFWPAAVLFVAGLFFVWRSYPWRGVSNGSKTLCLALKTAGLLLLVLFLLEPMWTTTRPREGANLFAIVADNSMGLELRDPGATQTRGELMVQALRSDQATWQGKLEETFMVRRYRFDSRLESTRDFADLDFEGRESAIGMALQSVRERFGGQPLAGVLLFTDGNATDFETVPDLSGLPPVYPVLLGQEEPLRDLALQKVSVTQTVFEDAPVTIIAAVQASGMSSERLSAELMLDGKTVAKQKIQLKKGGGEIPLRFQVKPENPGISFYTVRLSVENQSSNLVEATEHNNQRVAAVDRGTGPHRVLYVGGRPSWEYKYLNRAISEDPQVQLVGLIRIARREPKFTFRGRSGESSNPLFRGFKNVDEETERYDQPVLIRLNTKDEIELRSGFPKTAEDLYGFKAVILDDLEAEFFTADQMLLLQRYVSERGGGFLMLGGADSLENGKYMRTPIGDMLPVYLDRLPDAQQTTGLRLDLTREGWLEPWARLRTNEQEERERLAALPAFQVINQLREIKPGATVLATARARNGAQYPALVSQRFGNGRSAIVALGDLWRAGLANETSAVDLAKTWRQMVRWLIADVPAQVEVVVQPGQSTEDSGVLLQVRARDKAFQPLENAQVQLTVTAPGGKDETNRITLNAEASPKEAGVYQASYIPRQAGGYLVQAVVSDQTQLKIGEAHAGWTSEPLAREFQSLHPNRAVAAEIARKTGGEVIRMDQLEEVVEGLKKKKAPILETYSYPLWHKSSVFLLALACFTTEWGLRRWKGLA